MNITVIMMSSSSPPLPSAAAKSGATRKGSTGGSVDHRVVVSTASFPSTVWADGFLDKLDLSSSSLQAKQSRQDPRHEVLKEDVRKMVIKSTGDDEAMIADKLRLIDAVQRLGVGYHFETEIEEALEKVDDVGEGLLFTNVDHHHDDNKRRRHTDLYHAALRFRLLRQQGFPVPHDGLTRKLKNSEGKFREWMARDDAPGLLSLYEAAHLAFNGEDILDEALAFATNNLQLHKIKYPSVLQKQVEFALRVPAWKCVPRSLARHSIDNFCSEDYSSQNQKLLLTFAKLDFNMVQSLHQQELHELSHWWRSIDVATNFPYARDRLVECYYWIICVYFEPKYRLARTITAKIYLVLSLLDDTCDNFATYQEVLTLTEAVERLDVRALEELPDTMKNVYRVIVDLYDEIEREIGRTGPTFAVDYAKGELKKLSQAYVHKVRWGTEGRVPTLEQYMTDLGYVSSGMPKVCTSAFVGMGATREAFEWATNDSKMMTAAAIISRYQNDIFSHKFEQERNHAASAVECYMKQYGASREEGVEFLWKGISNAWKDIAEECQKPTAPLPVALTDRLLNLARSVNMFYDNDNGDRYTNSYLLKDHLTSLFIDSVPL